MNRERLDQLERVGFAVTITFASIVIVLHAIALIIKFAL